MTFTSFSKHLSKIEATPKRLEITGLLAELIKQTNLKEVEKAVNLSLGQLKPLYKDIDFNMAEKMMVRAIAAANDISAQIVVGEFKKSGDLGETAAKFKVQSSCPTSHGRPARPDFVCSKSGGSPGGRAKFKVPARLRMDDLPDQTSSVRSQAGVQAGGQSSKLSVTEVFDRLLEIAQDSGEDSQERKIGKTSDLLGELDPLSAKYAVRIILGNLRLGFSDRTVLDALSNIVAGDKSARKKLEAVYNIRPDIGALTHLIKNFLAERDPALREKFKIKNFQAQPELGTPILPALCQRLEGTEEIIEKMGTVAAEPKWDGQRIQAHAWIQGTRDKEQGTRETNIEVKLFTRGLEDVSIMFPDLVNALKNLLFPSSLSPHPLALILDGEVVALDPKTKKILPFQTMITRKRKYGIQEQLLNVPIRYMIFDIMYLNGKSLMNEPFENRRAMLERIFNIQKTQNTQKTGVSEKSESQKVRTSGPLDLRSSGASGSQSFPSVLNLAPQLVTGNPVKIRQFLKHQIDSGLEGIVAKRLDAPYSPGRTGFSWVKLKWEGKAKSGGLVDTIDCIVMGIYSGQGKRAGFGAGAFLVGILNSPTTNNQQLTTSFLTISKIGTGLTDKQWRELRAKGQGLRAKRQPKEYDVPKQLIPDTWLLPKIVVEIQADNITVSPLHTAGFALRFPRLVRYRDDKKPEQATTVEEVKKLYKLQG